MSSGCHDEKLTEYILTKYESSLRSNIYWNNQHEFHLSHVPYVPTFKRHLKTQVASSKNVEPIICGTIHIHLRQCLTKS